MLTIKLPEVRHINIYSQSNMNIFCSTVSIQTAVPSAERESVLICTLANSSEEIPELYLAIVHNTIHVER